jgi:hypothetical protein
MCTCFAPSNFAPIHSSVSAALRRLFFPPASRYADVDRPISFCSAGASERSKIVIFDLPDQPFNIHSKEAGSPRVLLCYAHNLPLISKTAISSLASLTSWARRERRVRQIFRQDEASFESRFTFLRKDVRLGQDAQRRRGSC